MFTRFINTATFAALLITFGSLGSAQASVINGIAVGSAGSSTMVGSTSSAGSIPDAIRYFIPLGNSASDAYGTGSACSGNGAGTCSDYGNGTGYDAANALAMNIYFDLSGESEIGAATLSFIFDDLDLTPDNDPDGFTESIQLSYWNWNGVDFVLEALSLVIQDESDLPGTGGSTAVDPNIITWDLSLAALGNLNDSRVGQGGGWFQLGFGSDFYTNGRNTPEYLVASLDVSAVPVPAAFWLFGTALVGFIGYSRRRSI